MGIVSSTQSVSMFYGSTYFPHIIHLSVVYCKFLIKLTLSCISKITRQFLLLRLKVRMPKISDKIGKFLLKFSNLF